MQFKHLLIEVRLIYSNNSNTLHIVIFVNKVYYIVLYFWTIYDIDLLFKP